MWQRRISCLLRRDRDFESRLLQRGVWCESDFRARVLSSGVQLLGEGMAKSELGAKPRAPLILH